MAVALEHQKKPLDRHFLLMSLVTHTYKRRASFVMRSFCRHYSEIHLSEFDSMVRPLREMVGGYLPRVPTFQHYATVLTEDGEYEKAIAVCQRAINYGLDEVLSDGSKSGYRGRIARIERRMLNARR